MASVSLEDIGQAESVLNRLIQERKSLEQGVSVLETYKKVVVETEVKTAQLRALEVDVENTKKVIASLAHTREVEMEKVRKDIEEYKGRQEEIAQGMIDGLIEQVERLKGEYGEMEKRYSAAQVEFDRLVKEREKELKETEGALEAVKKEYKELTEAIGRAAGVFTRSTV